MVELLDRVESGGGMDQVLDQLCADHPEHAQALRQSVRALAATGLLDTGLAAGLDTDSGQVPDRLGEFQLLAQLGAGGMGVVYLASQEGLGRLVALKLLRPEQMWFEGSRARFRREVEAVARLSHKGIAAVHTVGEERGLPYCAFEFVPGASLDRWVGPTAEDEQRPLREVVARRLVELAAATQVPSGPESPGRPGSDSDGDGWDETYWSGGRVEIVLRTARQVAAALAHAHQRGVLHRDVKPSNIVVTPAGRAVLVDFGLAALAGAARVTRTGAQLGSLAYMAPEQVRGRAAEVDERTDVYGLGVSLYELLAGKLPYGGEDTGAMREAILLAQAPPVNTVNPELSADVATVVAKAMAVEPTERYASAADLERDLCNLLEHRPIEARTPTTRVRMSRWARRRPAVATSLVLGTLFLVGGPVGWLINLAWTEQRVEASAGKEQAARGQAQRSLDVAVATLGDLLRVGRYALENAPGGQAERLASLDRTIQVFLGLEADHPDDLQLLLQGARLFRARGVLLEEQRYDDAALRDFDAAEARLAVLRQRAPEDHCIRTEHGAMLSTRARFLLRGGRLEPAVELFEASREVLLELTRLECGACSGAEPERDYAVVLGNYAQARLRLGELESSRALVEEGLAHIRLLRRIDPEREGWIWVEANLLTTLANGLPDDALSLAKLEEAVALHELGLVLAPSDREHRLALAVVLSTIGARQAQLGQPALGLASNDRALTMLRALRREYPVVNTYVQQLWIALNARGVILGQDMDPRAKDVFAELVKERCALADTNPHRGALQAFAAMALLNQAQSLYDHHGDAQVAFQNIEDCFTYLDLAKALEVQDPSPEALRWSATYIQGLLSTREFAPAQARTYVEGFEEFAGRSDALHWRWAADLWNELALGFVRAGDPLGERDAVERMFHLLDRAVRAGYDDVQELSTTPALEAYRGREEFQQVLQLASEK